jgi:hypothetical protein
MQITDAATGSPRWALVTIAVTTTAALAACSSSSTKPSTSATTPSATASPTATGPLTSAELAAKLKAGAASVTSARINLSTKVGTETVLTLQADEQLADGKLAAMNLTERAGTVNLTLRLADGVLYVKLPSSTNTTGKPWAKATADSTNPTLKQLASSLNSLEQSTSLSQYGSFVNAASSLKTIGTEQVGGTTATHYSFIVDVTKVDAGAFTPAVKQALAATGLTQIPVDMWVDEQGRTVKVSEKFTVQGQPVSTDFTLNNLNQPVTITAPPAGEVFGS